jgi:hypothetical protein
MKNYILFLFLVSSTSVVFGQNSNATKPEFKFVKELIDYGRIEQNSNGNKIFEFTNIGNSPIIITAVKTSCDCTVPKKPERPIMPGEKGTIEVTYDTSKTGGFIKQITIFSNAKLPVKKLRIKGIVVKNKSKLIKEKGLLENN